MQKFKIIIKKKWLYRMGKPVCIDVIIKNLTNSDYYIQADNTPFEDAQNNCFEVTRKGIRVFYDGIRVKRMGGGPADVILLRAGETKKSRICLSDIYAMYEPGRYIIKLKTNAVSMYKAGKEGFVDSTCEIQSLPEITLPVFLISGRRENKTTGDRLREWDKEYKAADEEFPIPEVVFHDTNKKETEANFRSVVLDAHYEMIHYLQHCVKEFEAVSLKNENFHYQLSFGAYEEGRYDRVKKIYCDVLERLRSETVRYERNQNPVYEKPSYAAYTTFGKNTIYISPAFYNIKVSGEDSRLGCLLHEWTHAVADTEDECYGREECENLADRHPELAVNNADNLEWFLETKFMNWEEQGRWPGCEDADSVAVGGGPVTVSNEKGIYLFYLNTNHKLMYAESDGITYHPPEIISVISEKGEKQEFCSEFHPEAIIYKNIIYVFYIPQGGTELHVTCLDKSGKWTSGSPALAKGNVTFRPIYPPQPVIYKNKIVLIYKRKNEEGFFKTAWGKGDIFWEQEGEIPDSQIVVDNEKYNPAVAVINNVLYIFYRSLITDSIKFAFYNDKEDVNVWRMDELLHNYSDLANTVTDYEIRAAVNGNATYLLMRLNKDLAGQIQANYLDKRKKVMWTDGEELKNNAFWGLEPYIDSCCSFVTYKNFNYMFGIAGGVDGISYSRQMGERLPD